MLKQLNDFRNLGALLCLMFLTGCAHVRIPAPEVTSVGGNESVSVEIVNTWDRFLKQWVTPEGRVDYSKLSQAPEELEHAYQLIARYSPESHPTYFPTENSRLAYWINAYNIAVMRAVLKDYPIDSVLDVEVTSIYSLFEGGSFFAAQKLVFGGRFYSLYHVENKIIRKRFDDPRFHFALNCASLGCPVLPREAFDAENLDTQLERETYLFIQSSNNYRINHEQQQIRLSAIFDWYEKDFIQGESTLLDYVLPYLSEAKKAELQAAIKSEYAVVFEEYDWAINDVK